MIQAGVMLIVKNGLILSISRKNDSTKFGLLGGKRSFKDLSLRETAIREAFEEANIIVDDCSFIFRQRDENDVETSCYYAINWSGEPQTVEEGIVKWLTVADLLNPKTGAFPEYNSKAVGALKKLFPWIYLK